MGKDIWTDLSHNQTSVTTCVTQDKEINITHSYFVYPNKDTSNNYLKLWSEK